MCAAQLERHRISMLNKLHSHRKRLMHAERTDRTKACAPDVNTAFTSVRDAWERLQVYHVFDSVLPGEERIVKCESEWGCGHHAV